MQRKNDSGCVMKILTSAVKSTCTADWLKDFLVFSPTAEEISQLSSAQRSHHTISTTVKQTNLIREPRSKPKSFQQNNNGNILTTSNLKSKKSTQKNWNKWKKGHYYKGCWIFTIILRQGKLSFPCLLTHLWKCSQTSQKLLCSAVPIKWKDLWSFCGECIDQCYGSLSVRPVGKAAPYSALISEKSSCFQPAWWCFAETWLLLLRI